MPPTHRYAHASATFCKLLARKNMLSDIWKQAFGLNRISRCLEHADGCVGTSTSYLALSVACLALGSSHGHTVEKFCLVLQVALVWEGRSTHGTESCGADTETSARIAHAVLLCTNLATSMRRPARRSAYAHRDQMQAAHASAGGWPPGVAFLPRLQFTFCTGL